MDVDASAERIREALLQKLPDLSKEWTPPPFDIELGRKFVKPMLDEMMCALGSKEASEEYWVRYYELSGIPQDSDIYVLPSSLFADRKKGQGDVDEYEEKRSILEDYLAEALWPMIKAGAKPLGSGARIGRSISRFVTATSTSGWSRFEHLWYWSIGHFFSGWYLFVVRRYLSHRLQIIEGMKKRAKETENRTLQGKMQREIGMHKKMHERESTLLHDAQAFIDCLYWWLNAQEIRLELDEMDKVVQTLGLSLMEERSGRIEWTYKGQGYS